MSQKTYEEDMVAATTDPRKITIYPIVTLQRDLCYGALRACELGYKVMPFPGIVSLTCDKDGKSMPVGLREAAIKLLLETDMIEGGPTHIYAESDFYPHISAEKLLKVLDSAPEDWEVIQLFDNMYYEPHPQKELVHNINKVTWSLISAEKRWGTHAMVFRNKSVVRRVIDIWARGMEPIDELLFSSDLHVYRPNVNFFSQYGINNYASRELPRDKRFLVGMMSYRRLKDACRQIYTFMDQTYKNFIMYVSLKGIAEAEWKQRLEPNFAHFIREGRLIVSVDPNADQLTNLCTIYNHVNPDLYDLLLKVDDDEWYDREYMERVNRVHASFSPEVGSCKYFVNGGFSQSQGYPIFWGEKIGVWGGSTVVYTKKVAQVLSEYVKSNFSKSVIKPLLGEIIARQDWTWREDNLLNRLLGAMGSIDREFLDKGATGLVVNDMDASVTRGIARATPFYSGRYSHMLILRTKWGTCVRYLFAANRCMEMENKVNRRTGQILSKGQDEYIIQWDKGKEISWIVHRNNGVWDEISR